MGTRISFYGRNKIMVDTKIIREKPENLIELNFEYGQDHQKRFVQIKGLNF